MTFPLLPIETKAFETKNRMKTRRYKNWQVFAPVIIGCTLWIESAQGNASLPPVNRTGAPGHSSCSQCHTGRGNGNVALSFSGGGNYEPGQIYAIMVAVTDPSQRRFGFSMVARDSDNDRVDVGDWSAVGNDTRVHGSQNSHVSQRAAPRSNGSHTFTVNWTAPSDDVGNVTFYVAANAANGNNSRDGGDNVYLSELTVSQLAPPNQPPSLTVPEGTLNVTQEVATAIEGISVTDTDSGDGDVTVMLSVENGLLSVLESVEGGVEPAGITDNGSAAVTVTGTLAALNATFSAPDGIVYQGNPEFQGSDNLQIVANDNGNNGGEPQSGNATVMILVGPPPLPQVPPRISDLLYLGNEGFQFTLKGVAGSSYILEHSEDFQTWELLQEVTLDADTVNITDPAAADSPFRYYRASDVP